jgi:hypothetical protein
VSAEQISGRVLVGDRAPALADVLLLDAGGAIDAHAPVGPDGRFALPSPQAPEAVLLARVRLPDCAIVSAQTAVPPPAEVDIALDSRALHALRVEIAGDDVPDELELRLTPRRVDGLPDDLLASAFRPIDGMADSVLSNRPIGRGPLELGVQAGRWLIAAGYELTADARSVDFQPAWWYAARATIDPGGEVPGGPVGFEVDVTGPVTITLEIVRTNPEDVSG